MAEDFTAKFKVDVSDLKRGISEANRQIKLANATFKAETAGMEDWTKDADGLSKKLDQLKSVMSNQKSILDAYKAQLEAQKKAYEENGAKAQQLKEKLKELAESGVNKADAEYKEYEQALKNCTKEQENNKKAVENLELKVLNQKATVGQTQKQINKYTKAQEDLGQESQEASVEIDKVDKSLEKAGKEAKTSEGKFSSLAKVVSGSLVAGFAAMTTAVAGGVTALANATTSAAEYADEVNTLSAQTGLSTQSIQEYKYAAELMDVSLDTLTGSLKKNIKSMSSAKDGTGNAAEAYKSLGVAVTDSNGNLRDSETVFWEAIEALGEIENETERDALAMTLFGKSAQDLNPMIEAGTDKIAELKKEAQSMGAVLSQDSLDALNNFDDSLQRLKGGASAAKNALGTVLLPQLQELADSGVSLLQNFTTKINEANGDWGKIGDAIAEGLGDAADMVLDKVPAFLEVGTKIVSSLTNAVVKASPKLAKTATSLLTTLTTQLFKSAPTIIQAGSDIIKNVISGLKTALPTLLKAITGSIPSVVTTLIDLASYLAQNAASIITPIITAIPQIISTFIQTLTNEDNVNSIITGVASLATSIVDSLPTVLNSIITAIPTIISSIFGEGGFLSAENIKKLTTCAVNIVKKLVDAIPTVISSLISAIPTVLNSIFGEGGFLSSKNISLLIDNAIDVVMELVKSIPDIISGLISAIPQVLDLLFGEDGFLSGSNITNLINGAVDVVMKLVENIPTIVTELIKAIPRIIELFFDPDDGFLSAKNIGKLVNGAVEIVKEIVKNTPQIIASLISKIPEIIDDIMQAFWGLVSEFWNLGNEIANALIEGILSDSSLSSAIEAIMDMVGMGDYWQHIKRVYSSSSPTVLANTMTEEKWNSYSGSEQRYWMGQIAGIWDRLSTDVQNKLRGMGVHAATGGVFDRATNVLLGEDGTEAVVPLEKHTGWISQVAKNLAGYLDGGVVGVPSLAGFGGATYSGGRNIQFVQNNYSPKSLSSLEVYRQTRNQIALMEKVMEGGY